MEKTIGLTAMWRVKMVKRFRHSKKWKDCVKKVTAQNKRLPKSKQKNPFGICTASLGEASFAWDLKKESVRGYQRKRK